jgi:hypothetical protein
VITSRHDDGRWSIAHAARACRALCKVPRPMRPSHVERTFPVATPGPHLPAVMPFLRWHHLPIAGRSRERRTDPAVTERLYAAESGMHATSQAAF